MPTIFKSGSKAGFVEGGERERGESAPPVGYICQEISDYTFFFLCEVL